MKLQKTLLAALLAALILSAGCASKETILSKADNGKQVSIHPGEELVVTLASNPTTGYTWEASNLDAAVLQQIGDAKFTSDNTARVGSGGSLTLVFKALEPGATSLVLVYHRPWEANVAPLDTFKVTVTVK